MISFNQVHKRYPGGYEALKGVSVSIEEGEIVGAFFTPILFANVWILILSTILLGFLFGSLGVIIGILSTTFDQMSAISSFVSQPLIYLGGVFYSTSMLPVFWQNVSFLNPILYMVNALRHAMIGQEEVSMTLAMSIICLMLVALTVINMILLKKGVGLRE